MSDHIIMIIWVMRYLLRKTCLIQDGSSPSLLRDQEIYLLSVLEHNPCQAVLFWLFRAILRSLIPRKLILGVFVRMALICSPK